MKMNNLITQCRERNRNLEDVFSASEGATISSFMDVQLQKLERNQRLTPLQEPSDFFQICEAYAAERLAPDQVKAVMECLSSGAMLTADHLGGFYSPQSFQGDLLFSRLMEKALSVSPRLIPCFAFGSVSLGAETYARGIQVYTSKAPERLPLFVSKYANSAASLVTGLDRAMIITARQKIDQFLTDPTSREVVIRLLDEVYLSDHILRQNRFGDQVTEIGFALTRKALASLAAPSFVYFEIEALCLELIIRDLQNPSSLLSLFLHDRQVIQMLNQIFAEKDQPVASLLFRGTDQSLRSYSLTLTGPGLLQGRNIGKHETRISFDDLSLIELMRERKLLPGTFLCALITAMARGMTWYGGIFQSLYLPRWQELTLQVLTKAGYPDLGRRVCQWDLSGYLSGPVFALYDTGGGAANAGPVEFLIRKPDPSQWDLWLNTDLKKAHEMGMFEFYHDLVPASEKKEGWYEAIAAYNRNQNIRNIL